MATLIAAIAALLIAIFGDAWRNTFRCPELVAKYDAQELGYCDTPVLRNKDAQGDLVEANSYYFSLRVRNEGDRSADNVEVFATDLDEKTLAGWKNIRDYSLDLKWAYLGCSQLKTLAPLMPRFCNIGHIIDPEQRGIIDDNEDLPHVERGQAIFSLDLEARPNHLVHLLPPGQYRLTITVVAANHRPVRRFLHIKLTGFWAPKDTKGMLEKGIKIQLSDQNEPSL